MGGCFARERGGEKMVRGVLEVKAAREEGKGFL